MTEWISNRGISAWMDEFASRCPGISRKFRVGQSVRRQSLWVLELSNNPGADEPKPYFKYIANMHGDEISGRNLLMLLAEWLCENNGKDDRATQVLRDMHLFIMPTMNPDGYPTQRENKGRRGGPMWDLNRNFPDHYRDAGRDLTNAMDQPLTQPEVAAVMQWSLSRPFTAAANFHEGEVVVNYPWDGYPNVNRYYGGSSNPTPENATYWNLARSYAKEHPMLGSMTRPFASGVTNGADWYPIVGSMQDWDYAVTGCMHMTLEISRLKRPPPSSIPDLWQQNRDSMLSLALAALGGVRGTVKSSSGTPLAATLHVKPPADYQGSPTKFKSDRQFGFYSRPLAPGGTFTLVATAPGYSTVEATVTAAADGRAVTQDFVLSPLSG